MLSPKISAGALARAVVWFCHVFPVELWPNLFYLPFGGQIRGEFEISDGEFGTIYAAGTLASAAVLLGPAALLTGYGCATWHHWCSAGWP